MPEPTWAPEELLALMQAMGATLFRAHPPKLAGPCEAPALEAAISHVSTRGGARLVEHPMRWETGRDGFARTVVVPDREGQGGIVGAMLDVTSAHHHVRQWQELESWLVSLGEALPFDFWIGDRSGRCVLQNPASVRSLGLALGRRFEELPLPSCWMDVWRRGFEKALAGETAREELHLTNEEPPRFVVRVISPVWGDCGVHGALGVDLDVTELKQTEAKLRESLDELARTQDALVRRRELAALGEMAAVVAHEIRNPLGAIANVSALLRRANETSPELLEILRDEVSRLDGLVRALLEYVRPIHPELQEGALAPIVQGCLQAALELESAQARVRVALDLDEGVGGVPLDGPLLRLALGNVMRNALQAMPQGGELRVTLSAEAGPEGEWAKVELCDSGPGLPEEVAGRLFQPFVTTRPTGSGMGLAMVKRIIDGHRGQVTLATGPTGGTVCTIRLPFADTPRANVSVAG